MKRKLLFAGLALLGSIFSAHADDVFKDVTSTYLTNADFEGEYSVHSYPRGESNKDRAIYLPTGWTIDYTNGKEWDMTVLKSGDLSYSSFSSIGALGSGGSQTYKVRFNNSYKDQKLDLYQNIDLPYGTYNVEIDYYKGGSGGDAFLLVNSTTTNSSTNGSWVKVNKTFTSDGSSSTKIGCRASHTNTNEKFYAFDNFVLKWNLTKSLTDLLADANTFYNAEGTSYTALKAVIDATNTSSTDADDLESQYNALAAALDLAKNHRKPWLAAWTTANTNYSNANYSNVTGSEKTALKTEIDNTEPSVADDYDTAKSALETANSTFTAAKTNYDNLVTEIAKAKALGIADGTANGYAASSTSTSESVLASTQALKVAEYTYVTTNYTEALTLAEGDWVASTIKNESSNPWDGSTAYKASNGYDNSSWNCSYSQTFDLPAGDYIFKVAGRRSSSSAMWIEVKNGDITLGTTANDFPKASSGLGINTSGETDFATDDGHTYANDGNGYGWEWRYVKFSLADKTTVTVAIKGSAGVSGQWINFSGYQVLATSDLHVSLYEYFKALNTATAARDNDTYTNVDGKEKADLLAAITTDGSLDKESKTDVNAATTALTEATTAFTAADALTNYNALATAISSAQAIVDANKNVGDGVFQIPTSAQSTLSTAISTATGIKTNSTKTKTDAESAATALNGAIDTYNAVELNAPDASKTYYIKVATSGHSKNGNAIAINSGETSANNPTGYTFTASSTPAAYSKLQAFTLTKVAEKANNYIISIDGPNGVVYLTNGTKNGSEAGHKDNQIQATDDSEKAMEFKIATSPNNGAFVIYNTETNSTIACESGGSIYTTSGNADFAIEEVSMASVNINIGAGKWATRIFPFAPSTETLTKDVKVYTATIEGEVLNLAEVGSPVANVPYILKNETGKDVNFNVSGYGTAKQDRYTEGNLVGIYTNANIAASAGNTYNYVLQTPNDEYKIQAFYKVTSALTGTPYRCYLTETIETPSEAKKRAIFFDEEGTTDIEAPEVANADDGVLYNLAGQQVSASYKGIAIKNGKKVLMK